MFVFLEHYLSKWQEINNKYRRTWPHQTN